MLADGPIFGLSLLEKLKLKDSAGFRKTNNNVFSNGHIIHYSTHFTITFGSK